MAVFGPIPLQAGFTSMGELADLIMKKRTEQERSRQFNATHQENTRQFNENLRFKQAEENRTQKKFPLDLQHMRDAHSTSMLSNMINKKASDRAEAAWPYIKQQYEDAHHGKVSEQGLADAKNKVMQLSYEHELDLANQRNEQQNQANDAAIPRNEPGDFLTQGRGPSPYPQVTPEAQKNNVIPMQPQVSPEAQAQNVNNPMMQNAPSMNQQAPNAASNTSPVMTPGQQKANEEIGKEFVISEGDPNTAYKNIEGKASVKPVNGYLIKTYDNGRVTATKMPPGMTATSKGMSLEDKMKFEDYKAKAKIKANGTEFEKNISKEDAKNLSTLNKSLYTARDIQPSLDYMHSLANSPEMQNIKQNPLLFGKDRVYFEKSKEHKAEAKVLGKMTAVQKKMYAEMAQQFKGAFRKGEQELFDRLLPSDSDSIDVMMGKIQGMETLNRSLIQRLSRVDDLVRDKDNGMTINHAMEQADKEFPISKTEKEVESEYNPKTIYSSDPVIQAAAEDAARRKANPEDIKKEIAKMEANKNAK